MIRCRGPTPVMAIRHRRHGVEVERKWKRKDYRQPGDQLVQIQTASHSCWKEKKNGSTDFS